MQPELNAIRNGLQFIEKEGRYKGYVDDNGHFEGVGILNEPSGLTKSGEWHHNKLHGCAKVEECDSYWGGFKEDKKEGYGTNDYANGDRYLGEFMDDHKHGYGIYRYSNGDVYRGQWN